MLENSGGGPKFRFESIAAFADEIVILKTQQWVLGAENSLGLLLREEGPGRDPIGEDLEDLSVEPGRCPL